MPPLSQFQVPKSRQLAAKETGLFRQLLQYHDERQYKKGVKTADTILKKNPEHGETLAMKGLILYNMGEKENGIDYVRRGVRLDLTSHIVWHVFGIVQRQEHKYDDALKSYSQALRHDPENVALIRDVCTLSTHLRQFEPLVDHRTFMLKTRPSMRSHWISVAVALDLAGHKDKALTVLNDFESTLTDINNYDHGLKYELSEIFLYHASILENAQNYEECLKVLDDRKENILDIVAWREMKARVLTKVNKTDEASDYWRLLIQSNQENRGYYIGFLKTKNINIEENLNEQQQSSALQTVNLFGEQFPKSSVIQRLKLDLSSGKQFEEFVDDYLKVRLTKGIPSLFVDLKALYDNEEKKNIIGSLVENYKEQLEKSSSYNSNSSEIQPITSYIWTLYYLSQHYSQLDQNEKSLDVIQIAIEHTPTLPELYLARGRALKRIGNISEACESVEEARELDGQDRFLNGKSAKYYLRNGDIEKAEKILELFTRKAAPSSAYDLCEMEAMWFMREEAKAFFNLKKYGMALKRLHQIFDTFEQWDEDQYDFHIYCLRKYTLRSYLETLKAEDELRDDSHYVNSAIEAAKIYVEIYDNPSIVEAITQPQNGNLDKKAQKKAKKAQAQAQQSKPKDGLPPPAEDKDPNGHNLLKTEEPIEVASNLLSKIKNVKRIDLSHIKFEVEFRRGKHLQALRALKDTHNINKECRVLHNQLIKFKLYLDSDKFKQLELRDDVKTILKEEFNKILPSDINLESFNADYLQRNNSIPIRVLGAAEGMILIRGASSAKEAVNVLFNIDFNNIDAATCQKVLEFIRVYDEERFEEFSKRSNQKFPLNDSFKSQAQLDVEKSERENKREQRSKREVA